MTKLKITTPTDTQIVLERAFEAPRALVWRALSEPELVRQWWGCEGSQMTTCEIDFRVGGKWRFVLRNPDGSTVGQGGEYVEIAKPDRIVNTEGMDGYEGTVLVTYTLVEAAGTTTMRCVTECHTKFVRDMILGSGMEVGAETGYARLEQVARSLL
ncbi:MAG: SRPBCC family protein [Kofleriaceae bacterium]